MDHSLQWKAAVRTTNLIENNDSQIMSISLMLVVNNLTDLELKNRRKIIGFGKWFMTFEITCFIGTGLTFQGHYMTASSRLQIKFNPARLGPTEKLLYSLRPGQI